MIQFFWKGMQDFEMNEKSPHIILASTEAQKDNHFVQSGKI